jgi:3-isopropylmalate/(R)-2-methylmalate dehydratase small subunit
MKPFVKVTGRAAPLSAPNIDTDVIMPKVFLKGVDRSGLDVGVFNSLRFRNGKPDPGFILNKPGYENASFLVVGPNFGCGSSREHAVWGLAQLGIRALIGTSFASIFDDNCKNNGILTVTLDRETVDHIMAVAGRPATNSMTVDLDAEFLTLDAIGEAIPFHVDPLRKAALLQGLDAVGATLEQANAIRAFQKRYWAENPWLAQN